MGALHPAFLTTWHNSSRNLATLKLNADVVWTAVKTAVAASIFRSSRGVPIWDVAMESNRSYFLPTDPMFLVSAELLNGDRTEPTPSDDVFSVGVLLFYMRFKRHPVKLRTDDTYRSFLWRMKAGHVDWPSNRELLSLLLNARNAAALCICVAGSVALWLFLRKHTCACIAQSELCRMDRASIHVWTISCGDLCSFSDLPCARFCCSRAEI